MESMHKHGKTWRRERKRPTFLASNGSLHDEREREISHFTLKIVSALDINILIWVLIPFLSRKK
jgi:hypothetical protein